MFQIPYTFLQIFELCVCVICLCLYYVPVSVSEFVLQSNQHTISLSAKSGFLTQTDNTIVTEDGWTYSIKLFHSKSIISLPQLYIQTQTDHTHTQFQNLKLNSNLKFFPHHSSTLNFQAKTRTSLEIKTNQY